MISRNVSSFFVRRLALPLIKAMHMGVLLFILLGWLFPQMIVLIIHLIFVPSVILHWATNDGSCFLTNITHWLEGGTNTKEEQRGVFIKSIIGKFVSEIPSDTAIKRGLYGVLLSSWLLSLIQVL